MKSQDPLTAEAIIDLLVPHDVKLSPTGDRVVYSAAPYGKKGEQSLSSLWLATTSTANSSSQITSGLFNDHQPAWRPDGNAVAFLSDRHKLGESSAIYVQQLSIGEPVPLTPAEHKKSIAGFAWSPDGNFLAYLSPDEASQDKERRDREKDDAQVFGKDLEFNRLRLVHVASRSVTVLVEKPAHVTSLTWSPDSKRIAYTLVEDLVFDSPIAPRHGKGVQFEVVGIADGKVEHLLDFSGMMAGWGRLGWASASVGNDEEGIYFIAPVKPRLAISSNAVHRLDVIAKTCKPVAHGESDDAAGLKVQGDLIAVMVQAGLEEQVRLLGGETLFSAPEELETWDAVKRPDGSIALVVATSTAARPFEVFAVDSATKKNTLQLSGHGAAITERQLGTSHALERRSYDDKVLIQGHYITPGTSTLSAPLPTVVLIHGGPSWRQTDSFQAPHYPWQPLLLAAGKYGVLHANYRGNTSQGDAFMAHVRGQAGTLEHDDVLALVDEAIAKGFADKEKIVVGGWSYGGLLSYLAAARNGKTCGGKSVGWKYRGAICGAGISDWEMMAMTADVAHFSSEMAGAAPWSVDGREGTDGRKGSAVWEMNKGAADIPPVLLLHGEKDDRVPVSQMWAFQRGCRYHGVTCEMVTYPREGHLVGERAHLVDMLGRVRRFCDLCIG